MPVRIFWVAYTNGLKYVSLQEFWVLELCDAFEDARYTYQSHDRNAAITSL